MKHDRTTFHRHVGTNASKCEQLHCFVALAGKGNFKWPHTHERFVCQRCRSTKNTIRRHIASPRVNDKCFVWSENPPQIKVHVLPMISENIQYGEYWIICEHKQSQKAASLWFHQETQPTAALFIQIWTCVESCTSASSQSSHRLLVMLTYYKSALGSWKAL